MKNKGKYRINFSFFSFDYLQKFEEKEKQENSSFHFLYFVFAHLITFSSFLWKLIRKTCGLERKNAVLKIYSRKRFITTILVSVGINAASNTCIMIKIIFTLTIMFIILKKKNKFALFFFSKKKV